MDENMKKIISEAKNICLIPSESEPESLTSSLALFYTLRELGKNVNLFLESLPANLNFLTPSVDFISQPRNFVISIPRSSADISQIYYEKTDDNFKIHLTADKGNIKKENISFYFQDAKPDLILTLGIRDFKKYLESKLDFYGFLLGSAILNIDNSKDNLNFGQINLIEKKSLSEIVLNLIKSINEGLIKKNAAECLLTGLSIYYENFKSAKTNENAFQTAAELVKMGADNQQIVDNLHKINKEEIKFLGEIFKNLKQENNLFVAILDSADFENITESETSSAVEKLKTLGIQNDLLVLWESHNSKPVVRGFFYSKKPDLADRVSKNYQGTNKNGWIFLSAKEEDLNSVKEQILKILQ